MQEGEC